MAVVDEFELAELDELEYRVSLLEHLLLENGNHSINEGSTSTDIEKNEEVGAWDKLALLEKQVTSFERLLNSSNVADQEIGSKCLAYSIVKNKWLEVEIEDKPTPDTMIVSYADVKREEKCEKLRPLRIDLAAMTKSEDILQDLIQTCLPPSNEIDSNVTYPYAIPLCQEGQRSIIQLAEGELEEGSKCLESIYCEPTRLVQFVASQEINEFPSIRLQQLDQQHNILMQQAHEMRCDTHEFIDKYAHLIATVNDRFVDWDSKLRKKGASRT